MVHIKHESPPPALREYGFEFFLMEYVDNKKSTYAHVHPAIEFIYISKGIFHVEINNDLYTAHQGDLMIFRSNDIHSIFHANKGPAEYYVLKFDPSMLFSTFTSRNKADYIVSFLQSIEKPLSHFPADVLNENIKKFLFFMIQEYHSSSEMMIDMIRSYASGFVIELFRTFFSQPSDGEQDSKEKLINEKTVSMIYESINYINENYSWDITAEECAKRIHLSYSYYAKMFHTIIGKSFKQYLCDLRLAKAHNKLFTTTLSITDIALSCGYKNLSYFIAEYKKTYGKTPKDMRKSKNEQVNFE